MSKNNTAQAVKNQSLPKDGEHITASIDKVNDNENANEIIKVEANELDTLKAQLVERDRLIIEERAKSEASAKQLEAERQQKEEFFQKYNQEYTERFKYQGDSIDSRIEAKKSELQWLEGKIQESVEQGQFSEMAKLSAKFAKAELEIENYNNQKTEIEKNKRIPAERPKTPTDTWIENHPEFVADESYRAIAIAAHHKAIKQRIRIESPEYFQFVEKDIDRDYYNKVDPAHGDDQDYSDNAYDIEATESRQTNNQRKMQSIPPSRPSGTLSSASGKNKRVTLTPEEVDIAMDTFGKRMSAADAKLAYWESKQELIRSGHIQ